MVFATQVSAQSEADRQRVNDLAQGAANALASGTSVDFWFQHGHPAILAKIAADQGLTLNQTRQKAQRGEDLQNKLYRQLNVRVWPERATFGTVGPWDWALVPQFARLQARSDETVHSEICNFTLFIGQDDAWYVAGQVGGEPPALLLSVFPVLDAIPFGMPPDCSASTS